MIIEFKGMRPDVEKATFIADSATLSGDIHLAENTSVWFGASVRAEVASITIGRDSNVQDNAMLHADYDLPITIGERVSVGHSAIVHGATIEDDVIVGMHATVMNGAHVGRGSIIAAGALVKEHAVIPECSLVAGVPGVVKRTFTEEEDHTVLMSSHITSDLDKIADYIAYIHEGRLVFMKSCEEIQEDHGVIHAGKDLLTALNSEDVIAYIKEPYSFSILISHRSSIQQTFPDLEIQRPSVEELMLFYAKGENGNLE